MRITMHNRPEGPGDSITGALCHAGPHRAASARKSQGEVKTDEALVPLGDALGLLVDRGYARGRLAQRQPLDERH
ncbi:hypothetical protein [Streptosporangium amethystogenes]|uniref:hypothetical protein n=1 Tax=Streptosporangium amethystogenes TaxID=2002 RepID=UPI0012FA5F92|nr:hypothetical protein [Streptosporangium amethystogenes]